MADKYYTLKVRIPCVTYKDVYVEASSKKAAKELTKRWLNGEIGADPYDFSGDYGEDQLYSKAVIESVTCDEEGA